MYKLIYNEDLICQGFCKEGIHQVIPSLHININSELKEYLMALGNFKIKEDSDLTKSLYTYDDKEIFEIVTFKYEKPKPTKADLLEQQNAFLIKESLEKDIQIKELNMDLAKATLKSINKDIEINNLNTNMAQTTLNLIDKDIKIKDIEKDVANLILKSLSLGGN